MPGKRLDASAEGKPELILRLRRDLAFDLRDRLFVMSGGAQRHCVKARLPNIGVRIQPQSGRELRRRLVEMSEQKEDQPSVQWLGSSLGASSTDFRAFASAASGSYSGKSGCISSRARNQYGPANSGSSWRTLSASCRARLSAAIRSWAQPRSACSTYVKARHCHAAT